MIDSSIGISTVINCFRKLFFVLLQFTVIKSRRGQTTPLMFNEGYIRLVYIFLNQVWQMSFLCSPVFLNLEVVTKWQIMTS